MAKLTGTWIGEYTYGSGYENVAGNSVPFALSLTESWLRTVTGYVRDDASRGGQPERGRIRGKRKGQSLEFTKTMPVGYVFDDEGNMVQAREFLERTWDRSIPGELPPHRIFYSGTIDELGESIVGEWQIMPWLETEDGEQFSGGSGTWKARRTSYQPSEV